MIKQSRSLDVWQTRSLSLLNCLLNFFMDLQCSQYIIILTMPEIFLNEKLIILDH